MQVGHRVAVLSSSPKVTSGLRKRPASGRDFSSRSESAARSCRLAVLRAPPHHHVVLLGVPPGRAVRREDRLLLAADVRPGGVGQPFELLQNRPAPRVVGQADRVVPAARRAEPDQVPLVVGVCQYRINTPQKCRLKNPHFGLTPTPPRGRWRQSDDQCSMGPGLPSGKIGMVVLREIVMIHDLKRQGLGISAIARRAGLDRKTVLQAVRRHRKLTPWRH